MPRFVRKRHWLALPVLAILALVPVYFLIEHPYWTVAAIGSLVLLIVTEHFRLQARLRKLAQSRQGESICEFARSFECHQVDTWVVRAVYEQLQEYLGTNPPVPIRATDRLKEDLPIDMEDLDMDLAREISVRTGRALTNTQTNPYYDRVKTVEDLVLFFNAQPRTAA